MVIGDDEWISVFPPWTEPRGAEGAPAPPASRGFQEAPGWNQGPRVPKAHRGQSHDGGKRNSRESQKSYQDNQGPLTSLTPAFLLTSWGLL